MDELELNEVIQRTIAQERQAMREEEAGTTTAPATATTATAPKGKVATDHSIAIDLLVESSGGHEAAMQALAADPQILGRLGGAVKQRRAKLQEAADAKARREFEASPAGRRIAAEAALAAREKEKRDSVLAREILLEDGYREDDLRSLRPSELIELSGLAEPPAPDPDAFNLPEPTPAEQAARTLRSKWHQWSSADRVRFATDEGISPATFAKVAESAANQTNPNIWGAGS